MYSYQGSKEIKATKKLKWDCEKKKGSFTIYLDRPEIIEIVQLQGVLQSFSTPCKYLSPGDFRLGAGKAFSCQLKQ